jgi:heptosyltransferase II
VKIVVRTPNWVGDAILALPAIDSLAINFPEAEITIAAGDWVREIFIPESGRRGILSLPAVTSLSGWKAAAEAIRRPGFDLAVLLTNSFGSALPFYRARVPERWGYRRDGRGPLLTRSVNPPDPQAEPRHHLYYYLDLLTGLGLKTVAPDLRLRVPDEERFAARVELQAAGVDRSKPVVILNPGASYGPAKRWPADRFAALADHLARARGARIVITGAAGEAPIAAAVAAAMTTAPINLAGRTTLRRLLAVIGEASLFITNDTGPMHMANALRVPIVALFGPTEPKATAPFHAPSVVLKKEAPCWPCLYRSCPFDHRCMTAITPDEAFAACDAVLG